MLAGRLRNWQDTVLLVKPGTVLRWHREAFGSSGRASRSLELGKARAATTLTQGDTIELVRRMAADNRTWGAERIRGELLKLGHSVWRRGRLARVEHRMVQLRSREVRLVELGAAEARAAQVCA